MFTQPAESVRTTADLSSHRVLGLSELRHQPLALTAGQVVTGVALSILATILLTLVAVAGSKTHYATLTPVPTPDQHLVLDDSFGGSPQLFYSLAGMSVVSSLKGSGQCLYVWPDQDRAPATVAVDCVGPELEPMVDIDIGGAAGSSAAWVSADSEAARTFEDGATVRFTLSDGVVEVDVGSPVQ